MLYWGCCSKTEQSLVTLFPNTVYCIIKIASLSLLSKARDFVRSVPKSYLDAWKTQRNPTANSTLMNVSSVMDECWCDESCLTQWKMTFDSLTLLLTVTKKSMGCFTCSGWNTNPLGMNVMDFSIYTTIYDNDISQRQ